ncbi:hypothetical protein HY449_02020 [Candidatus Pacearchaeota archaeon]|nr:hypothetical protein [Candidatus Pacearchaeota archaeon]
MKNKSMKKGLASYDKAIEEHKNKIIEEKKKENPNVELINYWEKEIKSFENNRKKLMGDV